MIEVCETALLLTPLCLQLRMLFSANFLKELKRWTHKYSVTTGTTGSAELNIKKIRRNMIIRERHALLYFPRGADK